MATHSSVLPGESQGWRSLVGCCLWGRTELDTTEATQQQPQHVLWNSSTSFFTTSKCLMSPFIFFSSLPRLYQHRLSFNPKVNSLLGTCQFISFYFLGGYILMIILSPSYIFGFFLLLTLSSACKLVSVNMTLQYKSNPCSKPSTTCVGKLF